MLGNVSSEYCTEFFMRFQRIHKQVKLCLGKLHALVCLNTHIKMPPTCNNKHCISAVVDAGGTRFPWCQAEVLCALKPLPCANAKGKLPATSFS